MPATKQSKFTIDHAGTGQGVWCDDWPRPEPGHWAVFVEVFAFGLNNTDVNTRSTIA